MAQHVIVIGAGIIGANAAYQLQKSGAQVTILDAGGPSATRSSFGWINASFYETPAHFQLRADGIAAFRELSAQRSLPIEWCGALCWENDGAAFEAQKAQLLALGYGVQEIDRAAFKALEPHVGAAPERCLVFAQEAAAASGPLAQALVQAATALGAQVIRGVQVQGFERKGGRVNGLRCDAGAMQADQIVVAAGTGTQQLMASVQVHVPMLERPALMIKTRPVAPILSHVLVSKLGELRQLPCGALLMPAAVDHQRDEAASLGAAPDVVARAAMERLQAFLPDTALDLAQATLAKRPVPQDGLPVVGAVMEGLYVATMHSGLTLGALMGQLIAAEVTGGPSPQTARQLAPFRPDRFA